MMNNGAPLEVIQSLLGHEKSETTKIYAQLSGKLDMIFTVNIFRLNKLTSILGYPCMNACLFVIGPFNGIRLFTINEYHDYEATYYAASYEEALFRWIFEFSSQSNLFRILRSLTYESR